MYNTLRAFIVRRGGVIGAFSYSGANFLLTFLVQSRVASEQFGVYAFALILIQFGLSLSNAFFSSPLVVALSDDVGDNAAKVKSFFSANIIYCVVATFILVVIMSRLHAAPEFLILVAIQSFAIWMRWFFRGVDLAQRKFERPVFADLAYAAITISVGGALMALHGITVSAALMGMASGAVLSIVFVGRQNFVKVVGRPISNLTVYRTAFAVHGRWALLGVITTEATANLHSYAIALLMGPSAFAPVAAITLFFRPIPILMQALIQYERPLMAQQLGRGRTDLVNKGVKNVRLGMIVAVFGNSLVVCLIMSVFPAMVGGGRYGSVSLWPICALLIATQFARAANTGSTAALQAGGHYRKLSFSTLVSAPLTLVLTLVAIRIDSTGVAFVLLAVLAGELVRAGIVAKEFNALIGRPTHKDD